MAPTNQHDTTIEPAGMTYERALEIAIQALGGPETAEDRLRRMDEAIDRGVRDGKNDVEVAEALGMKIITVSRRRRARGIGTLYEREQARLAEVRAERAA